MRQHTTWRVGWVVLLVLALLAQRADAALLYIGPGPGFALIGSFLVLFSAFLLAIPIVLSWPIRAVFRLIFRRATRTHSRIDRMIILGFDGMDPKLARRFMTEGFLPNLSRLAATGCFYPLATSIPSMSPCAWSSFMTGVDCSRHNIFDFITRDPCSYMPLLSSAEIQNAKKLLRLGKLRIPLEKPRIKMLRGSQPFWKLLGRHRIPSSILRVPITFPPEKFNGVLLSGMCVPDLRGTQGSFAFYTTAEIKRTPTTGGTRLQARRGRDGKVRSAIIGPENSLVRGAGEMTIPFALTPDAARDQATLEIDGETYTLRLKGYSPWIRLRFKAAPGMTVQGIARFYVNSLTPEVELYVTPINIDPAKPALPISHPFIYAVYLAKMQGPFSTLGLAEDTWALNERVIDEEAFLKQVYLIEEEREKSLADALAHTRKGLVTSVFDSTDRVQHMFFRYLDPEHPANRGKDTEIHKNAIREIYQRADQVVGKVLEQLDSKSVLVVMSDHGFTQFKRGCNLNTWLYQNGYLALKDAKTTSGEWFQDVDWSRTRAFSLGLTGVFINRKGREAQGTVEEGEPLIALRRELAGKLRGLVDTEADETAIQDVFITEEVFDGPYAADAPDLLIGYAAGYRHSWDCATGTVSENVFTDNTKSWGGDHCVDPRIVPGVFFCNRKINTTTPAITDIAPTVLSLFGVTPPPYMKGRCLLDDEGAPFTAAAAREQAPAHAREVKV
ncbi:MAG: alkaline phosphatase family protein [Planctomycetota bacterium]